MTDPTEGPLGARAKSTKSAKAYLVTSAGFGWSFWPSLAACFLVTHGATDVLAPSINIFVARCYEWLLDSMMRGAHRLMWWSVFGLLSSSCCALQLILNMFNFGCAGFNTYLGPVRPVLLAVTISLQVRMWELAVPNLGLPSTPEYYFPGCVASTVFTACLSFLPELAHAWVQRSSSAAAGRATRRTSLTLGLEGLGCVACTSAVRRAVERFCPEPVVDITVTLETAEAKLVLSCDEDQTRDAVAPKLISAISDAGFDASVKNIGEYEKANCVTAGRTALGRLLHVSSARSAAASAVAGLLSSSCCLLQLAVNLLATLNIAHIGCAGFNKVLGPWRFHLRAVTLAWLLLSWVLLLRREKRAPALLRGRLARHSAICLVLMFLPETLRLFGGPAVAPPTAESHTVRIDISGMGCEACEAHVRSVLQRASGVISGRADFQRGVAEVEIAPDWGFNLTDVLGKLEADGYRAAVPTAIRTAEL